MSCKKLLKKWGIVFDLTRRRQQLSELQKATEQPGFWDDHKSAQKHMQQISEVKRYVEPWGELRQKLQDLETLAQLGVEEDDDSVTEEIQRGVSEAEKQLADLELAAMLSGEYDDNDAIMTITAGAGGTEACDWAEMLLRMFRQWAENYKGYHFRVVSHVGGESAGIRNATARIEGPNAYGYAKAEAGVHRLVRISPFDSSSRRHTSFASVDVIPDLPDHERIPINDEDLKVDTFRASGAGGQHVNKTDSAVRIKHIPSGITVQCQNERSQHANRRGAMQILRARLAEEQRRQQAETIEDIRGEKGEISFANQIRSYVMHPYQMVKDHRTDVETSDVEAVMDGALEEFIRTYLQVQAGEDNEDGQ